jgi:hypothetical protein
MEEAIKDKPRRNSTKSSNGSLKRKSSKALRRCPSTAQQKSLYAATHDEMQDIKVSRNKKYYR